MNVPNVYHETSKGIAEAYQLYAPKILYSFGMTQGYLYYEKLRSIRAHLGLHAPRHYRIRKLLTAEMSDTSDMSDMHRGHCSQTHSKGALQ